MERFTFEGDAVAVVSVRDVAERAGVSVGTVSNVMNHPDKVSSATVTKVQAAIAELGFIRNDAARQLRDGRSKTIGLVVLDVRNPFFTDLARGAEDKAADAGLTVTLGNSDESTTREATYLDLFEQQRVHGVLISPYAEITERLRRLRDRGIPVVLVDRTSEDRAFSSVSVDDVAGGRLAAEHLIAQGRTRIAYIGGSTIRQVVDRLEGARQAVAAHPGVTLEAIETPGLSVIAGRTAGNNILARPASDRPDAIFAANDLVAMGVLQALMMQGQGGLRVPQDIALIGYDDIDFAAAAVVPLSSIRQPSALIGQTAVEILLEEAADPSVEPRQVVFQPELVVREST
jgi:LacI family transcriptional regulator